MTSPASPPEAPRLAIENRKFLRRAVRYLADEVGIRQFLDIGTGLPAQSSVHEIALASSPACRVVYAHNDPMVLAHSRALSTGGQVAVIRADLRDPQAILEHQETRRLLDFGRPVAIFLAAVLHFISDTGNPGGIVGVFRDAVPMGSYLVASHVTGDIRRGSAARAATEYQKIVPDASLRSHAEIRRFFDGFNLIEPGLVPLPHWRPDEPVPADADDLWILGGVGCKPPGHLRTCELAGGVEHWDGAGGNGRPGSRAAQRRRDSP